MDRIEFRPAFFTSNRLAFLLFLITVDLLVSFSVFPKLFDIYYKFPDEPGIFQIIVVILIIMIIPLVGFLYMSFFHTRNKKIWIEKDLIYFLNKSHIGAWGMNVFNLKNVTTINYKKKIYYFGKLPSTHYWIVFLMKNNKREEIPLFGWDAETLKNVIFYLKGKFPHIKFDTHVYRDSSAVISGVHEFLQKHKKNKASYDVSTKTQ